ncbi:hypothetical protein [Ornithinimicrobium sp. W1665]|uniref:hypothetical protein n=1 Tax=Ornithinimicrobium sp. W1665 TaxID=3416666 RepID=UPI003D6C3128
MQLIDPPVSELAEGRAEPGTAVRVEVVAVDVLAGRVDLRIVDGAHVDGVAESAS